VTSSLAEKWREDGVSMSAMRNDDVGFLLIGQVFALAAAAAAAEELYDDDDDDV